MMLILGPDNPFEELRILDGGKPIVQSRSIPIHPEPIPGALPSQTDRPPGLRRKRQSRACGTST